MNLVNDYIAKVKKQIKPQKLNYEVKEVGLIKELKDGVVVLEGLESVSYGEMVVFDNGLKAMVIDIDEKTVGAIVLGDYLKLKVGDYAYLTNLQASIGVSEEIIGRVVDPVGNSLDSQGKYKIDKYYPLEKIAPGVIKRRPVTVPLLTGIKSIDALIPIGRGQRELIIGDRSTGKTTIAVDTILNQKKQNVICIYCAIAQKNSKVAAVIETFKNFGAFDYTIVVNASASESAALQYLAPYSACAIAEYFMDKGNDVLVVYDDLTKHAWAYRQLSLILRRPAGREAYPGDIFYLHSRLLERACCLDKKYGGGTITALPIIETLEGDVSAYIPTNVISITDGQIFLETDLFNAGMRPAINVGISVSRVGGNAQVKAMKQVAGKLKLDLAQYREMAAFSQFESELDEETKKFLNRGAKITQLLKQNKHKLYSLTEQIVSIWVATNGYFDHVNQNDILKKEKEYLDALKIEIPEVLERIEKEKIIDLSIENELKQIAELIFAQNQYEPKTTEEKNKVD